MKVFLGYPSEHATAAREVWAFLKELDIDVWFDKESLLGGQHWQSTREDAQDKADFVIHLIADEMQGRSGDVHREIARSLDRALALPPRSAFILPILIDGARIPRELTVYQYLENNRGDFKLRLAQSLSHRFEQLNSAPPVPLTNYIRNALTAGGKIEHRLSETTASVELQGSYFQYQENSTYYDFINAVIAYHVLDGFHRWKSEDREVEDHMSSWEMNAVEHFRHGEFVSLMFVYSYYESGAAHGNFGIYTKKLWREEYWTLRSAICLSV